MMKRRTSLMVAYDILQEARGGSNKTRLVYRCNLNFKIIKTWLSRLIAKGLIEQSLGPPRIWITTAKGIDFLSAMEGVMSMWDDGGREPQDGFERSMIPHA